MSEAKETPASIAEFAAGGAMGLLVGALLGLSVSQVVAAALAALTALLGAFLGLSHPDGAGMARGWRTAAFGVCCVIGVAGGLTVRSRALLATAIEDDIAQWTRAGYPVEQARAFVVFQRLGIKLEGLAIAEPPKPGAGSNALFAGTAGVCSRIESLPDAEKLRSLRSAGGPLAGLAAAAAAAADPSRSLAAGLKEVCG